jgi:membrane fusion protein, multidrug efflux system
LWLVRSQKWPDIKFISTIVVALAGGGAWYELEHADPVVKPVAVAVPVTVEIASRQDLPIYLTGLGVVQASFTVSIRAQVDGKLEQVLFKEGEHVRKDDVLAKIDPRLYQAALDNANAQKAKDEAQVISARKDLERSRTLVNQFFETKQVVDQQQAKVDQVIAMVDADRAAIETAQTNLDYTSIVAPSDGRMGVRLIDPGNIVHASDSSPIVTLTLTQPSAVIFTLSARSLDDVRAALASGPVEVTAFSQDKRRTLGKGTLLLIDNMVDQASATMRMKAMFANEDEQLWPGDFVNARVSLKVLRGALTVPSAGHPTRARRYIRVGGRRRRCGPSASDHIRADDRWPHHDYIGAYRGRPGRRQRPIQASTELEGNIDLACTSRCQAGAGAMSTLA